MNKPAQNPRTPAQQPIKLRAKWSLRKKVVVGVLIFLALIIGLASGAFPFAFATVRCGRLPVATLTFAAAYSYAVPGDEGYGPSPFNGYVCTQAEAEAAGFNHSPLTTGGAREQEEFWEREKEDRRFSPEKVDFTAYTPTFVPARFTKSELTIDKLGSTQVFQELKTGEYFMANFRQSKLSDGLSYWVCSLEPCTEVGKDAKGRSVYKSYSPNNRSTFWGVKLEDTYFNIEAAERSGITEAEAIQMLGSLTPVTSAQ